ncbi:multiple sugar transport system permease protein/sn-glycerol 3-phosphate transport system permease protein [Phyllobacterium trifolii]|uniref:Multiple sugar transport system permease protein/sn-glycerol 3-phosphate transport system permease protein n=1 Tax=Phyllobacterium trifolii TaxID=300193 RepID=A0A839UFP0_9HYPH|nr:sugar ABC transporter permease [Phyllobacterium trifolii]MBB3147660.1 multiple sugar transport system permease protein/sn-glycerol 3-phosphate transport system permease protein [Phyllobacterium trifolii]
MIARLTPYAMVLPIVVFILAFTYWPILVSFDLSFRHWDFMSSEKPFVGLLNYSELVRSVEFWNSVTITLIFTAISVPLRLALAIAIARYLTTESKTVRALRGAFFLPAVTSSVAIAVIWSWIFSTDAGVANALLNNLGIAKVPWLQTPSLALWVIIIVNTWKQLGYDIVIYVAGLQAIPEDLYEAAKMDGGKRWHTFRRVTFPLVMPTTYFLLIVSVIESFQIFTIVDVMTQGGPAMSTDMMVNMLYRTGFTLFDVGKGSALAVLLFVFLVVLTVLKSRILGKRVHYEH